MSQRTRVLHFTTTAGDSDYFRALAGHSDTSSYELVFGTLHDEGGIHAVMRGMGLTAFGMGTSRRSGYPGAILRLARWLRRERVTVVHAHLYDGCAVGLTAATVAGVRLRVFTAHHVVDSLLHLRHRRRRAAFKFDAAVTRRFSDRAIAPSAHTETVLRDAYGVPPARIHRIPYGFSFQRQNGHGTARARLRGELGLGSSLVYIALGRLHWVKDLPTLLRAFAMASDRIGDAKLLIVGDGPERAALYGLVEELGISTAVIFTGHRSDAADVLSAADVLVNSSLGEAFNQAMMEGLATGLFVVATDVGAASELLADERVGLVVPVGDPASLARGLVRAAELCRSGGERRLEVASRYRMETMVRAYESLYSEALGARQR